MCRISLLLVVFLAASISVAASEDRAATYVVHMDKAQITALANSLGDSKKWYEAVTTRNMRYSNIVLVGVIIFSY